MEKLFASQRAQLNILLEGIGELGKGESAFTDREQLLLFNLVGFLCLVVILSFFKLDLEKQDINLTNYSASCQNSPNCYKLCELIAAGCHT